MAIIIGPLNGNLSGLMRSAAPSLKLSLRTLTTIQRDVGDLKLIPTASLTHRSAVNEDKNLSNHQSASKSLLDTNSLVTTFQNLLNIETIQVSALFYSSLTEKNLKLCSDKIADYKVKPVSDVNLELPNQIYKSTIIEEPKTDKSRNEIFYINPTNGLKIISDPRAVNIKPIEDAPKGTEIIEKQAKRQHRMLKIRKKKMKVHRRKRLWKRMWSVWKKTFFNREKKREVMFRTKLMDKVRAAEKFDAEAYVDDYLEDLKYDLTPKTYKSRKKPLWVIRELMERDNQVAIRKRMNNTNMLTNEPIIKNAETVEEFVERNWK